MLAWNDLSGILQQNQEKTQRLRLNFDGPVTLKELPGLRIILELAETQPRVVLHTPPKFLSLE
jgi:hypothetical protein